MTSGLFMRFRLKINNDRERKDREYDEKKPCMYPLERHHLCVFYGFIGTEPGLMIESGGNHCGLDPNGGVCRMEKAGNKSWWFGCPINTRGKRREIERNLDGTKVFLKKYSLVKEGGNGILLRDWVRHVTNLGVEE